MPQFDIFSFFSQISWVFFLFGLVYLSISYSLSPITATILKVRKLKFLNIKSSSNVFLNENTLTNSFFEKNSYIFEFLPKAIYFFKWNFNWNLFDNKNSLRIIQGFFLKNQFRYVILKSISTL